MTFEEFLKSQDWDVEIEFSGHTEMLKACWNAALDAAKDKVYSVDDHGIDDLKADK